MAFLQKHFLLISVTSFSLLAGLVYGLVATKKYEVSARIVINRGQIEAPNLPMEESKNRWVWVRDGYAIKDSLVASDFLTGLIEKLPLLRQRFESFAEASVSRMARVSGASSSDLRAQFVSDLGKQISVDFLGGDSFTFVITVRDSAPLLAKEILSKLIDRIRFLVVDETRAGYEKSLALLRSEITKKHSGATRAYLGETYQNLLAHSVLFEAQADKRVEVVQQPAIPLDATWPQPDRLLLFALLLGLAVGFCLEYVLILMRAPRVQTT